MGRSRWTGFHTTKMSHVLRCTIYHRQGVLGQLKSSESNQANTARYSMGVSFVSEGHNLFWHNAGAVTAWHDWYGWGMVVLYCCLRGCPENTQYSKIFPLRVDSERSVLYCIVLYPTRYTLILSLYEHAGQQVWWLVIRQKCPFLKWFRSFYLLPYLAIYSTKQYESLVISRKIIQKSV
jgi:hypothetical protein